MYKAILYVYDMNEDQLCEGIQTLKNTFNYGTSIMPELFERVVYNMIPNEQNKIFPMENL